MPIESLIRVSEIPNSSLIFLSIEISSSNDPLKNHSPGGNIKSPLSQGSIIKFVLLNFSILFDQVKVNLQLPLIHPTLLMMEINEN